MCVSCSRLWTALHVLWCTIYVVCGGVQLLAGIFFAVSVPEFRPYCMLLTGSWNIVAGISGGVVACIISISPRRQETFLYLAISVLSINCVNLILTEWGLYSIDMPNLLNNYSNHMLIDYACFGHRVAAAVALLVSFLDTQLSFCSMQVTPTQGKKFQGSHEQVSDIEYVIPRSKPSTSKSSVYDAYGQSWVFEAENPTSLSNATTILAESYCEKPTNGRITHVIDNPVVQIEEASDDSSNSDRKLCHMKSFSRSASPACSASSSQISLHQPIVDYLERLTEPVTYRSRLNTALSCKSNEEDSAYQAPQMLRMDSSPRSERVQYASLMQELQNKIVPKDRSGSDSTLASKTSDVEFSKELEAALQLIQDLESPNTADAGVVVPVKPMHGKAASFAVHSDSQSTSGYSSPSHPSNLPTPNRSASGSITNEVSYSIRNALSGAVISLYTRPKEKPKSITLVTINSDPEESFNIDNDIHSSTLIPSPTPSSADPVQKPQWKSLLKKKKCRKLCPELEGAIVKSESLAYLSDLELLARHQRNKEMQRKIEQRVIQQLGLPQPESNC